jgi:Dolichyl-phosphate-mannose-protein mannosyltransferase
VAVSFLERNRSLIPGFVLIALSEILIFFRHPQHFFMGDSVLWIALRYHSVWEFLKGFLQADPTLWYRPIAQRTVPSLLFPFVGLQPLAYRIVAFLLFFACTVAVFALAGRITQSRNISWLSTIYFAFHITHAFTTFDVAFTPELVFTLFSIVSAILFVDYLRKPTRRRLILSAVFFALSLLSKESAVALPFALLAIWILLPDGRRTGISSLAPHFAILAAYLLFAAGFIHIRAVDIRAIWNRPTEVGQPGYELVLGRNLLDSTGYALTWAFNISRGINGQWPPPFPLMTTALKVVRVLICAAALLALFSPRRKFVLIGIAWFFIEASPTLPLLAHFLPYYLFAPMVGFSIAVGTVLDGLRERLSRFSSRFAWAVCGAILAIPVMINAGIADGLEDTHFLLGGSARSALDGLNDVRRLYPVIPPGTTLVFFNEERPSLSWDQASGMLFQMAYNDKSIKSEYSIDGLTVTDEDIHHGRALALKLNKGRIVDFTPFVKQQPSLLLPHNPDMPFRLELSSDQIRAGELEYGVRVSQLKDTTVNALVAFNGVLMDPFRIQLNKKGEGKVAISGETRPGLYTFVALQPDGTPNWVTVAGSIRITP